MNEIEKLKDENKRLKSAINIFINKNSFQGYSIGGYYIIDVDDFNLAKEYIKNIIF